MRKLSCKFVFWPGDRYAEARASSELEESEKKEVSDWCVLFSQDSRLIDFISAGGICWLDVPAKSRVGRLHIRPQAHIPGNGARSRLLGLGIFYSDEWTKQSVPWHMHIRAFDLWFERNSNSPPADGTDLEIPEEDVRDFSSPPFNLLVHLDSKETVRGGGYIELLKLTSELVLERSTEWFSSVGVACNPPVADAKICAHLVARNFHKPGIRPFLPDEQNGNVAVSDKESPARRREGHLAEQIRIAVGDVMELMDSLKRSRLLASALASVGLLLLYSIFGGGRGADQQKELEGLIDELDKAAASAKNISDKLDEKLKNIDLAIDRLQEFEESVAGLKNEFVTLRNEVRPIADEFRIQVQEVKRISSLNGHGIVGQIYPDPVGVAKTVKEMESPETSDDDSAAVQALPNPHQDQKQGNDSSDNSEGSPAASIESNAKMEASPAAPNKEP